MQVSPDGGLLQFSTLSDDVAFTFAGGETRAVPGGYLELAQRQALSPALPPAGVLSSQQCVSSRACLAVDIHMLILVKAHALLWWPGCSSMPWKQCSAYLGVSQVHC